MAQKQTNMIEVVLALEGDRKPHSHSIDPGATVQDLLMAIVKETGRGDLAEVAIEDGNGAIGREIRLSDVLEGDFKVLHVSRPGSVTISAVFNGQTYKEAFRPSDTMKKVILQAMETFGLVGEVADFQLKLGEEVLPPDTHVGQVAKGEKELQLSLVMKIKPQG